MSTMIREVYDAFRALGIDEARASAAAEALSNQFMPKNDETKLATRQDIAYVDEDLAIVKARLATIEKILWPVALGVLTLVLKAFAPLVLA
jgi:hypothetical protein